MELHLSDLYAAVVDLWASTKRTQQVMDLAMHATDESAQRQTD
jgi:hypothetical protein